MKWNTAMLLALMVLILSILFVPEIGLIIKNIVKIFTEGNSAAKQILFLGYLFAFFLFRGIINNTTFEGKLRKKIRLIRKSFLALVILGFLLSISAQLAFQNTYGLENDSYAAHVTTCGEAVCWEATYLQHIHVLKSSIFFVEKTTGISLGSWTDNGQPMYEIIPFADLFSIAAIIILFGIIITATLLASEKRNWDAFLAAIAGIISTFAILDGGILSVAGVVGITILILYFLEKINLEEFNKWKPGIALVFAILIANIGRTILGTELIFKEWIVGPFFIATAFFLKNQFNSKYIWNKISSIVIFLIALGFILQTSYSSYTGNPIESGELILIYGLPNDITESEVSSIIGAKGLAKYGWYYTGKYIEIGSKEVESKLRQQTNPPGYLFAEVDAGKESIRTINIIWRKRPNITDFNTASFKILNLTEGNGNTKISGTTTLNGPHLALEIGSFIHSKGGDAIVISRVI